MVQALLAYDDPNFDQAKSLADQANQVSYISIFSFAGRIMIGKPTFRFSPHCAELLPTGVIADLIRNRFGYPRTFAAILVATSFVASQLVVYQVSSAQHLWKASVLLGLSYGMLFGLFPTLVLEWFGLGKRSISQSFARL